MQKFYPDYWIEIRDTRTINASWQSVPGTRHDRPHHYDAVGKLFNAMVTYAKRTGLLNGVRIMSEATWRKPITELAWEI